MADAVATKAHEATLNMDVQSCGIMNSTNAGAVIACIQQHDGLSQPCATCWAEEGLCAVTQCKTFCVNDPTSMACGNCVAAACGPTFALCSGLFPDGGFGDGGACLPSGAACGGSEPCCASLSCTTGTCM
jgi:hypothetical protein